MPDCMTFPDTVEEFMEQYKVVDTEQVYTNGTEFVPIYRMRQWFEHKPERKKGKWINRDVPRQIHGISCAAPNWQCSVCKKWWFHNGEGLKWYKFCPECGADMRGDDHDL